MRITRTVGDEGTSDTVPRHIWTHEVELTAARAVPNADPKVFKRPETRSMLMRWYNAGEPMWMAAESLAMMASDEATEKRRAEFARTNQPTGKALASLRHRMAMLTPSLPPGTKRG
jgi:hypothetical protein